MWNGAGKKVVGHSKLKLWTFFWGYDKHEWLLVKNWCRWKMHGWMHG